MDRSKSVFSPRTVIICVSTCVIVALLAVVFTALFFYFFNPRTVTVVQNVTELAVPLYRPDQLPWYLNGTIRPGPGTAVLPPGQVPLWHHELPEDPRQRLYNQLMFYPPHNQDFKKVLFWSDWSYEEPEKYEVWRCPVGTCTFSDRSETELYRADAVVIRNIDQIPENYYRTPSQVWVFNVLSPPPDSSVTLKDSFNWTATPRLDSDVPMFTHGIWMYYDTRWKHQDPPYNYASQKMLAAAAWMPSRCDPNSDVYTFVTKLDRESLVDVFSEDANCGSPCPQHQMHICLKLLRDKYRVMLVLEDRHCNHSIPDMFYVALETLTIPVVKYPPRAVYGQVVPEGSFIHLDDFPSIKTLAQHLEAIYADNTVFNKYQSWRGTGEFVKTWYCRLCAMLHHEDLPSTVTENITQWWRPEGECSTSTSFPRVAYR